MFRKKGDHVNTGEDIATAGDTGSIIGPALHFEIRHHGKPLDPMLWIDAG
jgi:septal ring factor EnvC (AmiA/AmiB activator)